MTEVIKSKRGAKHGNQNAKKSNPRQHITLRLDQQVRDYLSKQDNPGRLIDELIKPLLGAGTLQQCAKCGEVYEGQKTCPC